MSDEAIRPGYKRTEIGVIPDDWEVKRLDQIANVDPENLSASTDPDYAFVYISLEDVDRGTLRSYTEQIFRTAPSRARRVIRKGDVLVSTVRPNLKSHLYIKQEVRDNVCSTGFSVLRCKSCVSDPALIFFHLFAGTIEKQIESLLTGSNYPAINSRDVKALRIPFPPNANEQIAIADVLSDVDALLDALDRLITKKRAIKQAAMQALLTGRIRLPGFERTPGYKRTEAGVIPEDWEVKRLDEFGKWKGGATPSMANVAYWTEGSIPWVSSSDVRDVSLSSTEKRITDRALRESSTTLLPAGALLIVTRSGILRRYLPVTLNTIPMAINQDIKALLPHKGVSSQYVLQALLRWGPNILATCMKAGTTVESIEFPWLKRFAVPIPKRPVEQHAIAQVLSDMDAEIEALEKRRAKLRDIKQGMMQELLTGRIRLVQPQEQAQEVST